MRFGPATVHLLGDGGFRLDGGAMFGVVPKVLWEREKPADERNRIRMATHSLLVESGDDLVLVDSGIGDKNDARFRDLFGLEEGAVRLPEQIQRAGFELGDVSHVLLTHLHFDHCGWNTREAGGGLAPTFPRARYWLARGEVEHARGPNERDRASYDPRNWEPLFAAGVVELFDDAASPVAGVRAVRAAGHNRDMCSILVGGGPGEETLAFWSDLVPTAAHVPLPWIMGFDLFPMTTLENKRHWLPRAAAEGWTCVFQHDPDLPLGRVVADRPGRFRAEPLATA
jgi:glyoxylase-like metal-dependent hydrolase (beta-lactamase superfamily II)